MKLQVKVRKTAKTPTTTTAKPVFLHKGDKDLVGDLVVTAEHGEYNGKPTLRLSLPEEEKKFKARQIRFSPPVLQFGAKKARMILASLDAIRELAGKGVSHEE